MTKSVSKAKVDIWGEPLPVCPICHKVIVKDAHGGPHPSPGDHDPAYHVATNYGTWHESLGPKP